MAAIVTGGGSPADAGGHMSIGSAVALELAARGWSVLVVDLGLERAERTVAAIAAAGGEAAAWQCDVGVGQEVERMVGGCVARFGGIGARPHGPHSRSAAFTPDPEPPPLVPTAGVANVVGITSPKGILDTSEEDWNRVMSVNVTGAFLVTKHALPHLLARQSADAGAAIVNISSVSGVRYIRPEVAYTVSKGAVNSLTLSTAMEFADRGASPLLTLLCAVCCRGLSPMFARRRVRQCKRLFLV